MHSNAVVWSFGKIWSSANSNIETPEEMNISAFFATVQTPMRCRVPDLSVVGLCNASSVRGQLATVASCHAPGEPSHCTATSDSSSQVHRAMGHFAHVDTPSA